MTQSKAYNTGRSDGRYQERFGSGWAASELHGQILSDYRWGFSDGEADRQHEPDRWIAAA